MTTLHCGLLAMYIYIYTRTWSKTILGHPSWRAKPASWGVIIVALQLTNAFLKTLFNISLILFFISKISFTVYMYVHTHACTCTCTCRSYKSYQWWTNTLHSTDLHFGIFWCLFWIACDNSTSDGRNTSIQI